MKSTSPCTVSRTCRRCWSPGIELAAALEREDPRDAVLSRSGARLMDLPRGARVGTSSLRRRAFHRACAA